MAFRWEASLLAVLLKVSDRYRELWEKGLNVTVLMLSAYLVIKKSRKAGFPDDISTSAAMSSLYQSACALG